MVQVIQNGERIQFDDGFELYPDKHVLLGYTEDYEDMSGVKSGVVLVVGERNDKDEIWDLYTKYLQSKQYGELYPIFFGVEEVSGVYA